VAALTDKQALTLLILKQVFIRAVKKV
jgi:hypothetical protein